MVIRIPVRARGPSRLLLGTVVAGGLLVAGTAAQAAQPPPRPSDTPGAAATVSAGEVHLAYTAAAGDVWVDDVINAEPSTAIGGRLVDGPATIFDSGWQGIVFGRGTDDRLWWSFRTRQIGGAPDVWSTWAPLGGVLTSKPAAVFRGPQPAAYSVFARGADGALWQRDHDTSGWLPWERVGGRLLEDTGPAAAQLRNGETWVVVVGTDRQLHALQLGSGAFTRLGGLTTATPGLTAPSGTTLVAYVRGLDGAAWSRELPPGGAGWHTLGGRLTSGVAVTGNQPPDYGTVYLFGLATDGRLWWRPGTYPDLVWWYPVP
jgi:hypothetical protein